MIVTDKQLREILRNECKKVKSQAAWAKKYKISPSVLSDVINGRRGFTDAILKALKAKRIKNYEVPVLNFEDIK